MSRVRSVRRRVRCLRKGHYWLQRLDSHGDVALFCPRCGRRGQPGEQIRAQEDQLGASVTVN